jgi:ABC-type uncharacterized transport system permease subunit
VGGYGDVVRLVLREPRMLFTVGIMLVKGVTETISNTFWAIVVTRRLNIPNEHLALYPFARSVIMLAFFFLAMPRIRELKFRNPMMIGFAGLALSQVILILIPEQSYGLLLLSTCIEACSYATISTQMERMTAVTVNAQERARIMGLLYLSSIAITSPFGWIAGQLSEINRIFPFILGISLYLLGIGLVFFADRQARKEEGLAAPQPICQGAGE